MNRIPMLKRTLSTIVLWALAIVMLWGWGNHGGVWLVTVLSLFTQHEFYRMLERTGMHPFRRLGMLCGTMMLVIPFYMETMVFDRQVLGLTEGFLAASVLLCSIRVLGERNEDTRVETLLSTLFGIIYVPFLLHFLVRILHLGGGGTPGLLLAVWLIAASKFSDVGALLTGLAIGRHKMAPSISPKKTWEGAAGGILFSMAVSAALSAGFSGDLPHGFTPLVAAVAAVPVACVSIISDLIESVIKRRADIKDSSSIIPGIGGFFDLTDSLLLSAPVGYLILVIILQSSHAW